MICIITTIYCGGKDEGTLFFSPPTEGGNIRGVVNIKLSYCSAGSCSPVGGCDSAVENDRR